MTNTNLTNRIASLRKRDAELETVGAEQNQTIKQITDNFFKVTGELNSKLDSFTAQNASLKTTNAEQAQTIKQITDNFFKVTGELDERISLLRSLKQQNDLLRKQIATLEKINATLKEQLEELRR